MLSILGLIICPPTCPEVVEADTAVPTSHQDLVVRHGNTRHCVFTCNTAVQGGLVQCSAVQCGAVYCSALQIGAVQFSAVRCSAVQCSAVRIDAVQCRPVQCSAVHISSHSSRVCMGSWALLLQSQTCGRVHCLHCARESSLLPYIAILFGKLVFSATKTMGASNFLNRPALDQLILI